MLYREGLFFFTDTMSSVIVELLPRFWKAGASLWWPVKSWPNEKTGAQIENRCECAVVENSAWTRGDQKNIVVWMWLIVQAHVCLMEMFELKVGMTHFIH